MVRSPTVKVQQLVDFFQQHGGMLETSQLRRGGFSHYQLNQLLAGGQVLKVKQGLYQWQDAGRLELLDVMRIVPQGIGCLFTAAQHYGLTTFVASTYHLAIPKKAKVVLPFYPPIRLYYWDKVSYTTGTTEIKVEGGTLRLYDREKTICDMIRLRNKVGMDTVKEVLQQYLQGKDRNLDQLSRYAQQLNIAGYVSNYLGLLL